MIFEISLFGTLVHQGIATAVVVALLMRTLRRPLASSKFYALFWHPALVDCALFVGLWAAAHSVPAGPLLLFLLG